MQILDTNPQLFFHLQQQNSGICTGGACSKVIIFNLICPKCPLSDKLPPLQQSFLEELERTVALLAFVDVKNSPIGDLLDISQHLKTASEVNAAILTSQSHEKG
uniref:CTLH/CRA C-terminal to LisH motif domain-containing protein n=1 Tax=Lactuca sativa TaxID=4236 RepID=A0A9R1XLH2_LACSA|nr:hypothetical protein LSAT_V11C300119790 [Lactuca sativa]